MSSPGRSGRFIKRPRAEQSPEAAEPGKARFTADAARAAKGLDLKHRSTEFPHRFGPATVERLFPLFGMERTDAFAILGVELFGHLEEHAEDGDDRVSRHRGDATGPGKVFWGQMEACGVSSSLRRAQPQQSHERAASKRAQQNKCAIGAAMIKNQPERQRGNPL